MPKRKNIKNKTFNRLTVLSYSHTNKRNETFWNCVCICGNKTKVKYWSLKSGNTKSCGCLFLPDLRGKKFGKLTVLKQKGHDKRGNRLWECLCDCGNKKKYPTGQLNSSVRSCSMSCGNGGKLPEGQAAFNSLYKNYKQAAKKRNHSFNLSKKKFKDLTKLNCYYCGSPPSSKIDNPVFNGIYIYNGIDRINNINGYSDKNVVACCKNCNYMKGTLSTKDFLFHIKKIFKYNRLK